MTPERWQQIERLYHAALVHDGTERAAFLEQECAGDLTLRQEVESLIAHEGSAEGFLVAPPVEAAAKGMEGDVSSPLIGRQLGSYKIQSLIDAGGMGEVYRDLLRIWLRKKNFFYTEKIASKIRANLNAGNSTPTI
jgi:hypothetical protein